MAAIKCIVLIAACISASVNAHTPFDLIDDVPMDRNTIFGDERLQGEIFEDVDVYESRNTDESAMYRLPTTTKPYHYDVYWQFNMAANSLSVPVARVAIQLYATQANVNEIVIHAEDLNIQSVVLRQGTAADSPIIPTTYRLENETQFMYIWPTDTVLQYNSLGDRVLYTLTIEFSFPLRTDMYGIYRSWYRNVAPNPPNEQQEANTVIWMASSQFQATSARKAFPCYDEPSFKAKFTLTISRPEIGYKSWSCTRQRTSDPSTVAGYTDDIYETTPVMSTYLLALIVAQYDSVPYYDPDDILLYEVIARPRAIELEQGDYAFNTGRKLLDRMSNHTDLDFYSVSEHLKMTQAAIPDFSAGAMENWGLLTYREAYLMYYEGDTSHYFKQLIAYILSHEIAHMWFGNLVTCDWWDVLWLNEGFARYYQYFLTDWEFPGLGLGTRFITEQIHTSLLSDSANNPQPLSTKNIGSPAAVSNMFSTISYNKGAAVIRMTEHLLGFDVHEEGLRNYLVNNYLETALPIDLFQELQNVSVVRNAISQYGENFNIIDYYKSWTEQPGHPVLYVQVNHATGEMVITQRRFNINTGVSSNNLNYIVPITFATASNPDFEDTKPTHIIRDSITVINRGSVGDEWVVFNKKQTGFYRVYYDDYTWDLIALQLQNNITSINEFNRAQIVDDLFQFARSGLMKYTRALSLLSFLEEETAYAPWLAAITGFNWLRNRLASANPSYLEQLHLLIERLSAKVIGELTYDPIPDESFMNSYLRYQLGTHLCAIGVQACRTAATQQFRQFIDNGVPVYVNNRNWVYCNGLRDSTAATAAADFNALFTRFRVHEVYSEKIQLLMVLGCTHHEASLNTLLNAIVSDNYMIRPQDYTTAFSTAVSGNEGNTQIVFNYIKNNLPQVRAAFNDNIRTPLSYITARLRSPAEIEEFQIWANNTREELGDRYETIYNDAVVTRNSIEWTEAVLDDLDKFFQNETEPITTSTEAPIVIPQTTTVTPSPLQQPATPELPEVPESGAATSYISVALLAMAGIVNYIV